jgi:hypothetical protein
MSTEDGPQQIGHAAGTQTPVVLFDRSDGVWVFPDYMTTADWVEAIDVDDGEYDAYDADGFVLALSVVDGRVHLCRTSGRYYEQAVARLKFVLSKSPATVVSTSLPGMIQELLQRERKGVFARLAKGVRTRFGRGS